jgi:hypothetical protein
LERDPGLNFRCLVERILHHAFWRSGDEIYVPERSWFSRNSGVLLGTMVSGTIAVFIAVVINNEVHLRK